MPQARLAPSIVSSPATRRGGAAVWLILLFALTIGLLLAWQANQSPAEDAADLTGQTEAAEDSNGTAPDPGRGPAELVEPEDGVAPVSRVETEPLPYREMPRSYDGQGEISGEVFPATGEPFPDRWTLRIRPSQFATGREQAISKDLEFEGAQTTFEVRDLPMASYTVQVAAEGQASRPVEVSLFRIEGGQPGASKERSHIMLRFEPLSEVRVELLDALGQPALGLPIVLEAQATRERWEAVTDARGMARIQEVPEGLFRLYVGSPQAPHMEAATLKVLRTEASTWRGELPPTQTITVRVIDDEARVLPDAVVRGHGPVPVDVRTDQNGEAVLRYLPFGRYRLRGEHAASQSGGRQTVVIPLNGPDAHNERVTLTLRRKDPR